MTLLNRSWPVFLARLSFCQCVLRLAQERDVYRTKMRGFHPNDAAASHFLAASISKGQSTTQSSTLFSQMSDVMTSDLTLSVRDDDPWHVSKTVFDVLNAFINCQDQPDNLDAAKQLDALAPSNRDLREDERAGSHVSFLLEFWEPFLKTARQVPHDHEAQGRLVELVAALKGLGIKDAKSDRSIWTSLGGLENCIQESWSGKLSIHWS